MRKISLRQSIVNHLKHIDPRFQPEITTTSWTNSRSSGGRKETKKICAKYTMHYAPVMHKMTIKSHHQPTTFHCHRSYLHFSTAATFFVACARLIVENVTNVCFLLLLMPLSLYFSAFFPLFHLVPQVTTINDQRPSKTNTKSENYMNKILK